MQRPKYVSCIDDLLVLINSQHANQNIQKQNVRAAYLFGSQVYGNASANADFDVLLIVDSFVNANHKPPPEEAIYLGINKYLEENPNEDVQNSSATILPLYNEKKDKIVEVQVVSFSIVR